MPRFVVSLLAASLSVGAALNEEQGVRLMQQSAMTPMPEEAQVYLPEKMQWVIISTDATYYRASLQKEKLLGILTNERRVHLYHTHPAERRLDGIFQDPGEILPSGNDLSNMILGSVYAAEHQPGGEHEEHIISSFGITTYSLTPKGLAYFQEHWRESQEYAKAWEGRQQSSRETPLEKILQSGNDEYIRITLKNPTQ